MTDEKFVFVEDLRDKKDLARSARHRTGQGNRKGKSFAQPSEHYKILRKKNGEVMEYKIGQPITWEEFKSYPHEMQQKWVDVFVNRFVCGRGGMCIVLGVPSTTIGPYFYKYGLSIPTTKQLTVQKEKAIRDWMAESSSGVEEKPEEPVEAIVSEPKPVVVEKKRPEPTYFVHTLQEGNLNLSGTATEIFQTLYGIFRDAKLNVSLSFEVIPEPEPELEIEEPEEIVRTLTEDERVDLNKASFDELKAIGFFTNQALNVIQHRPYEKKEDLLKVPGITSKAYHILGSRVKVVVGGTDEQT